MADRQWIGWSGTAINEEGDEEFVTWSGAVISEDQADVGQTVGTGLLTGLKLERPRLVA